MNKLNNFHTGLLILFCMLMGGNSFSVNGFKQSSKQFIVVIDPGHGGKDPGAVNKSIREKDVVLAIGIKLGKLIKENNPEVKVVFTRNTDVFIPLIERSRIANKNKADLFISLHANACGTPATRGTETFTLGPSNSNYNLEIAKKENSVILLEEDYSTTYEGFDPNLSESYIMFETIQGDYIDQSLYLADAIQQQFTSRIQSPNRGVKQAGFLVLRQSSMPSVLVEAGFLSNAAEAKYLNSEEGQEHIALSVFEAFRKFKSKSSGSNPTKTQENIASQQSPQESAPKQEAKLENQKPEEKRKVEKDESKVNSKNTGQVKETTPPPAEPASEEESKNSVYYSVQIGANKTPVEPVAANFKGVKNVRREKEDQFYRYYVGNENHLDNIETLLKQVKLKFPQAFIVSFVDEKRVPLLGGLK